MPRNNTPRVFISYCRHDEDYASLLEEYLNILKSDGKISVFRDRHLETGAQWEERLRQEIASADIGICLLTPAYLASRWCLIETRAFAEQARTNPRFKVLPIHLRHCPVKLVVPELLPFQILPSLDESVVGQVGDRLEEAGSFFSRFITQLAALLDELDPDPDPPSAPGPGAPAARVDLGEVRARDNVVSLKAWKKKQGAMLERWVRRSGLIIDFGTSALVPIAAQVIADPVKTYGRWLFDILFGQQEKRIRRGVERDSRLRGIYEVSSADRTIRELALGIAPVVSSRRAAAWNPWLLRRLEALDLETAVEAAVRRFDRAVATLLGPLAGAAPLATALESWLRDDPRRALVARRDSEIWQDLLERWAASWEPESRFADGLRLRDLGRGALGRALIKDLQLQLVSGRRRLGHPLEGAEALIGQHQEDRFRKSVFLQSVRPVLSEVNEVEVNAGDLVRDLWGHPIEISTLEVPVRENLVLEMPDLLDPERLTAWCRVEPTEVGEESATTSSSAPSIRWRTPTETRWWLPVARATWSGSDLVPPAGGLHPQSHSRSEEAHHHGEGSADFGPGSGKYFGDEVKLYGMLEPVQQPGDAPHEATTPTDCPGIGDFGWLPSNLEEAPTAPSSPLTH